MPVKISFEPKPQTGFVFKPNTVPHSLWLTLDTLMEGGCGGTHAETVWGEILKEAEWLDAAAAPKVAYIAVVMVNDGDGEPAVFHVGGGKTYADALHRIAMYAREQQEEMNEVLDEPYPIPDDDNHAIQMWFKGNGSEEWAIWEVELYAG